MLDFNDVLATPNADIQYFEGSSITTLIQWQTWKKPRGARWVYMLGVGGGGGVSAPDGEAGVWRTGADSNIASG